MEKIDFFGGLHGNFLELLINLFIYEIDIDTTQNWFTPNGACHSKNRMSNYFPKIKCNHYSYLNLEFSPDDNVIEIHCDRDYMLPALVNSFTRAGDQNIDICYLENNTINKLAAIPKATYFLEDLIQEHGMQQNYSRSVIRNYFYSKFDSPELGLNKFNNFKHTGKTLQFPFHAFFDLEQLYFYLNQCAFFLNMDFYPSDKTCQIWKEFIDRNQGFQSQKRCQMAINHILNNTSMYIGDFNLVEEAWILYKLSTIFRCYNHSLFDDHFPDDTKIINKIIYEWKYNDRNTT
jgi:hypothetical protein